MVNMSGEKQMEILESYFTEEDADKLRDMRQERGGVDGNTNYKRAPARQKALRRAQRSVRRLLSLHTTS